MVGKPNRRMILGAMLTTTVTGASGRITVRSPNGLLRVAVVVVNGRLRYEVVRRGRVLVASSGLGLDPADRPSLTSGLVVESVERRTIDESWRPVWGSDAVIRNHAEECVLRTVQPSSAPSSLCHRTPRAGPWRRVPIGTPTSATTGRPGCPTCVPRRPRSRWPPRTASTSLCEALCGAGAGNFGVVTALEFATEDIRDLSFTTFAVAWPTTAIAAVLQG